MEQGINNHESVLIQSMKAQNRACFVATVFLMRRYRWSFQKTLEFLNSRRPDLEMRPSFLQQLVQYESKLIARGIGPKTNRWGELSDTQTHPLENEELILRNTYLNSKTFQTDQLGTTGPIDVIHRRGTYPKRNLEWRDVTNRPVPYKELCEENRDEDDLVNLVNPPKQMNHRTKHKENAKSALKGTKQYIQ